MAKIIVIFISGCLLIIISELFSHYDMLIAESLAIGAGGSAILWAVLKRVSVRQFHESLLMMGLFFIFVPLTLTLKASAPIMVTGVFFALGVVLSVVAFFRHEVRKKHIEC